MARPADALRDLPDSELEVKLAEVKEELFNLRFQLVTGTDLLPPKPTALIDATNQIPWAPSRVTRGQIRSWCAASPGRKAPWRTR